MSEAQTLDATANLLKEKRLTQKANRLHAIGEAAAEDERKLPMTADSLSKLGAGTQYGTP